MSPTGVPAEQTVRASRVRDMGELKGALLRPRFADCERPCDPVLRRLVNRKHSEGGKGAQPGVGKQIVPGLLVIRGTCRSRYWSVRSYWPCRVGVERSVRECIGERSGTAFQMGQVP